MQSIFQILAAAPAQAVSTGSAVGDLARQFGVDWPMLIAQIVSFGAVAYVLYRFAFKPVLETLDTRKTKIESGLAYAAEMQTKLQEAEAYHKEAVRKAAEEAKRIVDEARAIAEARIAKSTQEAAAASQDLVAKARSQIELDRKQMIAEARSDIARLVVATAAKVLAKDLSAEDKSRFNATASQSLVQSSN